MKKTKKKDAGARPGKPDMTGAEWRSVGDAIGDIHTPQLDRIEQKLDQLLARPYWWPFTPPPAPHPWQPQTEPRTPTDPWGNPTIY